MAKLSISLLLCSMFCMVGVLPSWSSQKIVVQGKVKNATGKMIVFYRTVDGIFTQSADTLQIRPDSTFTIGFPADSPEKIDFILWGKRGLGSVYLKPGITNMDIDVSGDNPLVMESTPENKVMKKLSELDDAVWKLRSRKGDIWNIAHDTIASSVYDKLTAYASSMEKEFGEVDESLKSKAVQDVRMQLLLAFINQYFVVFERATGHTREGWNTNLQKMLEFVHPNHPDNVFSSAFSEAIRAQLEMQTYDINRPDDVPKDVNGRNQVCFAGYEKKLKGRVREVAMAQIILGDYQNEEYATGIPELYDRFVTLYPQSVLLPLLNKAVTMNKSFNQVAPSNEIRFIDSDSIQTFAQLISRFSGKVIFVDIWATWCSPCRKSFAYVKPLQQYAKEKDVVLLYISIDRPRDKAKWEKMANYYDLKGEHVIVNQSLDGDIRKIFGKNGTLYIPHCAIINTKGEPQFLKAASPEDIDKLTMQLKEAAQ